MASKRAEKEAWRRLVELYPQGAIQLKHVTMRYSSGRSRDFYEAYSATPTDLWGIGDFEDPMQAVESCYEKGLKLGTD